MSESIFYIELPIAFDRMETLAGDAPIVEAEGRLFVLPQWLAGTGTRGAGEVVHTLLVTEGDAWMLSDGATILTAGQGRLRRVSLGDTPHVSSQTHHMVPEVVLCLAANPQLSRVLIVSSVVVDSDMEAADVALIDLSGARIGSTGLRWYGDAETVTTTAGFVVLDCDAGRLWLVDHSGRASELPAPGEGDADRLRAGDGGMRLLLRRIEDDGVACLRIGAFAGEGLRWSSRSHVPSDAIDTAVWRPHRADIAVAHCLDGRGFLSIVSSDGAVVAQTPLVTNWTTDALACSGDGARVFAANGKQLVVWTP